MAVTGTETYTTVYTYDANNRLLTESKTENSETVTTTYTYDANGNTLTKSTPAHGEDEASSTTYTCNGFNQLIALTVDGTSVAYAYNAQGIRTAKRVNNLRTAYLLDGGNVVAEVQNNTVIDNYLRGVNLIRRTSTDETEYYLFNAHGDVVTTTNLNGAINQAYDYDAFGNEKNPDALDTNPFRYCGEYLDAETGDYYLRARYYAPSIGRFTQQDTHWNTANMIYGDNPQKINAREDILGLRTYTMLPQISAVGQSGNLYVYCGNSPVKYYDATGETGVLALQWTSSMWWLIGADGPVPIGDLVYVVGIGVLSIVDALLLIGAAEGTASKAETSTALANSMATSAASAGAPDPKDDKNKNKYSSTKGGGGTTNSINIDGKQIDFGHGGRHLEGSGLSLQQVEQAIAQDVITKNPQVGVFSRAYVKIFGKLVEYHYFLLENGTINVGTYFIVG